MRPLLILLVTLPLAACQAGIWVDESSGPSLPPANSRLVLNQELVIPAGTAHVTLQGGRVVSVGDIRSYYPHCRLEVYRVLDVPQTVSPDTFVIRKAFLEDRTVGAGGFRHVSRRAGFDKDGSSIVTYRTVFHLASGRQPDVRWLECEQWGDAALGRYLTLDDIRKALGDIMTLAAPAAGGNPA